MFCYRFRFIGVFSAIWPISFNNPYAFAFRLDGTKMDGAEGEYAGRDFENTLWEGVFCLTSGVMTFKYPNRLPGSAAIVIAVLCFAVLSGYNCPAARGQRDSINSTPSKQKLLLSVGQGSRALQQGDNAAAEAAFRQAYRLAPQSVEVLNDLAISIARQGREDEAIALYERALRLKPGDVITRRNLGVAYFRAHRYKSALPLLESFSKSTPTFQSLDLTGIDLFALDKYAESATYLERASQLQPNDIPTLDILGQGILEGQELFRRYKSLRPDHGDQSRLPGGPLHDGTGV